MKINHILASLAILAGILAAFTNHSERNHLYPTWKYEKDRIQGERVHFISATHLADLLYQKKEGITILDLRDEQAFREYHIPLAKSLDQDDKMPEGDLGSQLIIYGVEGDPQLNQLSGALPGEVYVLKGGIEAWYKLVLFPDFIEYQVRNNDKLEQIIIRSGYFGGSPRNTQLLNIELRESSYREGC